MRALQQSLDSIEQLAEERARRESDKKKKQQLGGPQGTQHKENDLHRANRRSGGTGSSRTATAGTSGSLRGTVKRLSGARGDTSDSESPPTPTPQPMRHRHMQALEQMEREAQGNSLGDQGENGQENERTSPNPFLSRLRQRIRLAQRVLGSVSTTAPVTETAA